MWRREARPRSWRSPWRPVDWVEVLAWVGLGVVVAGLVFLYLWQGAVLASLRAQRATALLALQELEHTRLYLEYQVDRAYSLETLAEKARKLGMVPFDEKRTRIVILDERGGGR